MKKYVLISVIELDITYEVFETLEEARVQMRNEFKTSAFEVEEKEADGDACLLDNEAWICEGYNHDNYSWKIIEV